MRLLFVAPKTHGEKSFLGDPAFAVEEFRVNRDLTCAVDRIADWAARSAETFAHHAKRLPEQANEQRSIKKRKQRSEHLWLTHLNHSFSTLSVFGRMRSQV